MASDLESQPHYPFPILDSEEARSELRILIARLFSEAIEQVSIRKNNQRLLREIKDMPLNEKVRGLGAIRFDIFSDPFRHQVIAEAGIGKTTAAIVNLERCKGMTVWFMVPTLALAKEVLGNIKKSGISAEIIFYQGRNEDTCPRYEAARKVGSRGLEVQKTMCKNGDDECPFYNTCSYQEQFQEIRNLGALKLDDPVRVIVMTHGYLTSNCAAPEPDLVIIDETHWQGFLKITSSEVKSGLLDLTLAELRNAADKRIDHYGSYKNFITALIAAMQKSELTYLRDLVHNSDFRNAIEHIRLVVRKNGKPRVSPMDSDWKILSALQGWNGFRLKLIQEMLEILAYEMSVGKRIASAITYDPEKDTIRLHALRQNMIPREIPVLIIDASADLTINRYIWGSHLQSHEIRTERNVEIIQVRQQTFSKASLGIKRKNEPSDDYNDCETNKQKLWDVLEFVNNVADEAGEDILFVASKQIIEELESKLNINVKAVHFGALRGRNEWEKLNIAIILGREEPWYTITEGMARALRSHTPKVLLSSEPFRADKRNRRLKGSKLEAEIVRVHIDDLTQRVLEQIREREIEQTADRMRLIYEGLPKKIFLLTSVVIDATIAETKTWEELQRNTKMDKTIQYAFTKAKAFPLGDRDILAAAPKGLWSTQNAVGSYITRHGNINGVVSLVIYYMGSDPLLGVQYRRHGQRGNASIAIVSALEPDPKAALENVIGAPVAKFEIVERIERKPTEDEQENEPD